MLRTQQCLTHPQGAVHVYTNRNAYRKMLPFFLIVLVMLLLVVRLRATAPGGWYGSARSGCEGGQREHVVRSGETCWLIATDYGTGVDELRAANGGVDCGQLRAGDVLCVRVA